MAVIKLSIHIFRRDLRLDDNTALLSALQQSELVIPVFIFDERQLSNPYRGNNSFEFMVNSLTELDQDLRRKGSRLFLFKGMDRKREVNCKDTQLGHLFSENL